MATSDADRNGRHVRQRCLFRPCRYGGRPSDVRERVDVKFGVESCRAGALPPGENGRGAQCMKKEGAGTTSTVRSHEWNLHANTTSRTSA